MLVVEQSEALPMQCTMRCSSVWVGFYELARDSSDGKICMLAWDGISRRSWMAVPPSSNNGPGLLMPGEVSLSDQPCSRRSLIPSVGIDLSCVNFCFLP
mmetsp:Transcript_144955/g.463232  ORF Transcript_144955/g.463232 Transcript_144955/m.463232 type:complete len:99 (+) Transcript_144955:77-373(+)